MLRTGAWLRWLIARVPRVMAGVAAVVLALQVSVIVAVPWAINAVVTGLPSIADVKTMGEMAQATVFYDVKDAPAFTIFEERRFEVALADVSPHLTAALVAIEDQRFRAHWGVDVVRIAGALLANVKEGRLAQGGSTITQQLARQSFLTLDKTYTRKIQEALLALRIERQYTKDQILELYLNKMYFGAGLYGAEAASLGYFGKPSRELTVAEAAHDRRSGEVAVHLGAHRESRTRGRAQKRRARGDARDGRHRRGDPREGQGRQGRAEGRPAQR